MSEAQQEKKAVLYCSFCDRSQHEVKKLIAGPPEHFICDECVGKCLDIIMEAGELARTIGFDLGGGGVNYLKEVKIDSISRLLQQGGLKRLRPPYNAHDLLLAFLNGLELQLRPPEDQRERDSAIRQIDTELGELDKRRESLLTRRTKICQGVPLSDVLAQA